MKSYQSQDHPGICLSLVQSINQLPKKNHRKKTLCLVLIGVISGSFSEFAAPSAGSSTALVRRQLPAVQKPPALPVLPQQLPLSLN